MSFPTNISSNKTQEKDIKQNEELEFYRKRCEILESDLFKLQTLNKKLVDGNKKLQELNSIYAKVINGLNRI